MRIDIMQEGTTLVPTSMVKLARLGRNIILTTLINRRSGLAFIHVLSQTFSMAVKP